ncbi:MAG: serine/threonine-protein kinase [Nostoc sp.]|uniref:serine/threonine protein kinase n=1 Tax=Nostoc sp. TaxID=1180 RepID=UPI002FF92F27
MDKVEKTTNWHNPDISLKQGRYTIKKKLSDEGKYCIIYLAEDIEQKKLVTIKTLKDTVLLFDNNQQIRNEFKNEIDRLCYINSKLTDKNDIFNNIVHHKDIFTIKVRAFEIICLVMEYIDGNSLEKLVEEQVSITGHKVLDETKALDYISQVGKALTFVHENNLLHLDVNPKNIMIRSDIDKPVLIDFGTARFISNYSQVVGFTRGYAPPEQCKESNDDLRAFMDVYALAATLYYLLTGKDPVDAPKREKNCPLKEPQEINNNVSDNVNQAIIKGMALQASECPQTVKEWLELLNKYDANDLINSPDKLKEVITLFNEDDLNYLLNIYHKKVYEELKEKTKQEQIKTLIYKLQGEKDTKYLIDKMKYLKPEYFT